MYNNSIEDIMIDKNYNNKNKKGSKIFVILIILILLLALAGAGFAYYMNITKETSKQLFFKGLLNSNINFFIKNDTYKAIAEKVSSNSFEMNNELSFSTNIENEELEQEIDIRDFLFNLKTVQNVENKENYNEVNLTYSDNNLLNVKLINNEEQIAVFSDEIVNKYVGIETKNIGTFLNKFGLEIDTLEEYTEFKNVENVEKIDISEEIKAQKKEDYSNFLLSKLPEEKFTSQENQISLVKEDSKEIVVNAYTLNLTKEEYISIIKEMLLKLKNDEELIKEFLADTTNDSVIDSGTNNNSITNSDENNTEEYDYMQDEITTNTQNDTSDEETVEIIRIPSLEPIGTEIESETNNDYEQSDNLDIFETMEIEENSYDEENVELGTEILVNVLLGKKSEVSIEDIRESIDKIIETIEDKYKTNSGKNFEMTVYVSELQTEKISISFPDKSTIDIELNPIAENEKNLVITCLYEEKEKNIEDDELTIYSGSDENIEDIQNVITPQTNGIKLEIYKLQNDASTTLKTVCNIIEDKKINQKISLNITTKGTENSKSISNDCTVTYSDNEGEIKAYIKNKINFDKISEIEKLNDENCLFLDKLSDEELFLTIEEISRKIDEVIFHKKESLNFIDTNSQAPGITANNVNRDELRNLLITTISLQMGEAQVNGEEYTLENVLNLQIQGHMVSVDIVNDIVQINIDGVKFMLDRNFNLSDA